MVGVLFCLVRRTIGRHGPVRDSGHVVRNFVMNEYLNILFDKCEGRGHCMSASNL